MTPRAQPPPHFNAWLSCEHPQRLTSARTRITNDYTRPPASTLHPASLSPPPFLEITDFAQCGNVRARLPYTPLPQQPPNTPPSVGARLLGLLRL